jgi:hypothetical protein
VVTHSPRLSDSRGFFRRHAARFIGSAVLTVCLLWALKRSGLELVPSWSQFAHVRWWTVPTYFAFMGTMTYFRAVRWRFLLRRVAPEGIGRARLLAVSLVGFAGILLLPFRLGEFVRPALLHEKGKVSFTAATGSIIAERIVDGLYLSILLVIALVATPMTSPLPDHVVGLPITVAQVRGYAYITFAGFLGGFLVLAVYFFARDFAKRLTLAVFGVVSRPLAEKLAEKAEHLANGLGFFGNPRDAAGFMFETTLYWFTNAAGMWFLAWGAGLVHTDGSGPTFLEAIAMMGTLGVTILIPSPAPGLLGIFQAGMFCGMTMYYPVEIVQERGGVYAFLMFVTQMPTTILAGAVAMWSGHTSLKTLAADENLAQ